MAAAVAGGGRRGGVRDRAGPDVQGGDVRVHHQGEVRGLAKAGVHCRQEKGQTLFFRLAERWIISWRMP